jgi:hypothetical protein
MRKFHSIAALCGDGLRPELQALFDRLAIDPHSEFFVRSDGMTLVWARPHARFFRTKPQDSPSAGAGQVGVGKQRGRQLRRPYLPISVI